MGKKPSKERVVIRDICTTAAKKQNGKMGDEVVLGGLYFKMFNKTDLLQSELKSQWYFDYIENTKVMGRKGGEEW